MKSQKELESELEEKDNVLKFLQKRYEEDTGKKLDLPPMFSHLPSNSINIY